MSVNKVILLGNLGSNPEVKETQKGSIANLRIATSEKWKDKQTGEYQERTEWHSIVFFGKIAEVVERYLQKGMKVYIEGELRTDKWQDKEGNDRYTTKIYGRTMKMLGNKNNGGKNSVAPQATQTTQPTQKVADFDDDIPF